MSKKEKQRRRRRGIEQKQLTLPRKVPGVLDGSGVDAGQGTRHGKRGKQSDDRGKNLDRKPDACLFQGELTCQEYLGLNMRCPIDRPDQAILRDWGRAKEEDFSARETV